MACEDVTSLSIGFDWFMEWCFRPYLPVVGVTKTDTALLERRGASEVHTRSSCRPPLRGGRKLPFWHTAPTAAGQELE